MCERYTKRTVYFNKARTYYKNLSLRKETKIVILANRILDIELTKFFCWPNKFLVFPKNLFDQPTKEFLIVFCLTKLFVRRTKILLRHKKKVF